MTLATGYILQDALQNRYAIPAFSVHSNDMIDAVLDEAELAQHPVLLQIGQRAIRNGQMKSLTDYIRYRAGVLTIPVVIHLDHSHLYSQVVQALRTGLTSCMIDASALKFDDNIAVTKSVVELCHSVGIPRSIRSLCACFFVS